MNKGQIYIIILVAILFLGYTIYSTYFKPEKFKYIEIEQVETLDTLEFSKPITNKNINKNYSKPTKKAEEKQEEKRESNPQKNSTPHSVNLNTADLNELENVYYIAEKSAKNIIEYRDKLGGYVDVFQLKEALYSNVYDKIPLEVFYIDTLQVKKLKIRELSALELARHPYITNTMAEKIVDIREHHKLTSKEEFLMFFDLNQDNKYLINYLDFSQ